MSTPFYGTLSLTSNDSGSPHVVQLTASVADSVGSTSPRYQLDTSGLINLVQWTVNNPDVYYGPAPSAPNPISNVLFWKVDDVDFPNDGRTLMTNFSSSAFNIGNFLDISMWITSSIANSAFFFTVLGGSGSVMMEIPTKMRIAYQSGSSISDSIFFVSATSSIPPNDTHPQMQFYNSVFETTSSINESYGLQFANPASSSAVFYLDRRVDDVVLAPSD